MAEVLSQDEIEALLSAMTTVQEETSTGTEDKPFVLGTNSSVGNKKSADGQVFLPLQKRRRAAAEQAMDQRNGRFGPGPLLYEPYDFRRPDKLSKEHLRSLQLLHETFANYFASSLAGYLRSQVQIEVVSVEQVPYDEYMRSISASLLNILNVTPLSGQAIFETDFGILFSMMDRLLGGTGASGKVVRDLTDIERMLADNIVEHALENLRLAWETIHPLSFDVASTESSSQFVQIVPGNDTVVLILMEFHMGDHQGAMSICIPYLLIKPILHKLTANRWYTNNAKKKAFNIGLQLADRLNTTYVPCVARLGLVKTSVEDVMNLEVGNVLTMNVPETGTGGKSNIGLVDLLIGNHVKFRGKTGLRGKKLAVQISEVVAPPEELMIHKEAN